MSRLRVALVGTGYMARKHAAILAEHPAARLEVVCGTPRSRERAEDFLRTYGFRRSTLDWRALLEDREVDVVVQAAPDGLHPEHTAAFLEAGKHVLCEKPLGTREPDFERLRAARERSGRVLQVGMNCRYRAQYTLPRERLAELGELRFLRGVYLYNSVAKARTREKPWWFEHRGERMFFMHTAGVHCVDLLRWIGGPVRSVFARSSGFELGEDFVADTYSVSLAYESGALGELTVSAAAWSPREFSLELWASHGSIRQGTLYRRAGDLPVEEGEPLPVVQPRLDLWLQFEDFARSVREGAPVMNDLAEACANYRLIAAFERSLREGAPCEVKT